MKIVINGEFFEAGELSLFGYLPMLSIGRRDYYLAETSEEAGKKAREYWADLANRDPKEFACLVGEKTLVAWGLGQSTAGLGSSQVSSLDEWLDLWLDIPEDQWGTYDGSECSVDMVDAELVEELGFTPTVAYRHN